MGNANFTFDAKSRQTLASNGAHTANYIYDIYNRRASKVVDTITTVFLWVGDQIIAEYV